MERIKTQFVQTFGFEQLLTWDRLKQMGLISLRESALSIPRDKQPATANGPNVPPFQQVSHQTQFNPFLTLTIDVKDDPGFLE